MSKVLPPFTLLVGLSLVSLAVAGLSPRPVTPPPFLPAHAAAVCE